MPSTGGEITVKNNHSSPGLHYSAEGRRKLGRIEEGNFSFNKEVKNNHSSPRLHYFAEGRRKLGRIEEGNFSFNKEGKNNHSSPRLHYFAEGRRKLGRIEEGNFSFNKEGKITIHLRGCITPLKGEGHIEEGNFLLARKQGLCYMFCSPAFQNRCFGKGSPLFGKGTKEFTTVITDCRRKLCALCFTLARNGLTKKITFSEKA